MKFLELGWNIQIRSSQLSPRYRLLLIIPFGRLCVAPASSAPPKLKNLLLLQKLQLSKKFATEAGADYFEKGNSFRRNGVARPVLSVFQEDGSSADRVFIKSAIRQWRKFPRLAEGSLRGHVRAGTLTIAAGIELQRKLIRRRGPRTEGWRDCWPTLSSRRRGSRR